MDSLIFSLDSYMFRLIDGSGFVILLLLGILKILAKETKIGVDDKIINMLLGVVRSIKKPKPNTHDKETSNQNLHKM